MTADPAVNELHPLPRVLLEPLVRAALLEDLGRAGDITTDAVVAAGQSAVAKLVALQNEVVAGLGLAAFGSLDNALELRL